MKTLCKTSQKIGAIETLLELNFKPISLKLALDYISYCKELNYTPNKIVFEQHPDLKEVVVENKTSKKLELQV